VRKISRQRKWQIKQKRQGLCIICGKKAITAKFCEFHRQDDLKRKKKWRKNDQKF